MSNIILAGVARSGSTLVCHLLNKLADSVALHEPIDPSNLMGMTESGVLSYIDNFFSSQRIMIREQGVASSKSFQGKVPDNPMGGVDNKTGKRIRVLDGNMINIEKKLSENFYLAIKQPGLFTAMLESLVRVYPCYATIRNPLGVLLSWGSVNMAVSKGHAPAAEQWCPELAERLRVEGDVLQRQLVLLSWYFEQFYKYLPDTSIIRYEDVVLSGGQVLKKVVPHASFLSEELHSRNRNPLYQSESKSLVLEKLLASDGYYWQYYTREDVIALM